MMYPATYAGRKRYFDEKRKASVREWWSIGDGIVHIPLNGGVEAIIDQEDVEKASHFAWLANLHRNKIYVESPVRKELSHLFGNKTSLHRVVFSATKDMPHVDHRNGNPLDCRKTNLRFATRSQNASNFHRHNKTGYRGVGVVGSIWFAQIRINYRTYNLGYYDTPEDAARAYNVAATKAFGDFAILNKLPCP